LILRFGTQAPAAANIPGLLESRRDGNELRLTLANYGAEAASAIAGLGASSVDEAPITLEDAVVAYLGRRGEQVSLLQSTVLTGAAV
jgi:hypothetical protein